MARLTLHFREHPLRLIPLHGERMVIGRDPGCEIHIDSLAVAPRHVRLEREGEGWRLAPWDREAVVHVNGERLRGPRALHDGDVIRVGKHSLHYSEEASGVDLHGGASITPLPTARLPDGYLQFLNGAHVGRTIRLDRAMTRIGRRGEQTVLVARRRDGYYLSLLEGETPPERNGVPLGEHAERLENGDVLQVGSLRLQFFLESGLAGRAEAARERRFTRIAFPVDARLEIAGAVRPCRVLDLSLKGALVELPDAHALPAEPVLVLEIPLEESVRIRMETTLVRQEGERAGLACRNIDVESMTHLRRLVALNTGDPGMLERELAELG